MNSGRFINSIIFLFIFTISFYSQTSSFRGLTPLVSTRGDVEKLLGKSKECFRETYCNYELENIKISIEFSLDNCKSGWNISKDVVLEISVKGENFTGKSAEELKLNENEFVRATTSDVMDKLWTNSNNGIQYYFNHQLELYSQHFIPKKSDNYLRCNGFPPFVPEAYYNTSYELRLFIPRNKDLIYEIYNRIDSLLNELNGDKDGVGYIMVYFDDKLSLKAYRQRLSKVKNLIVHRKFNPARIKIIEGGMREESEIQFYVLYKDRIPPAPNPTLPSPQFMKKSH